MNVKQSNGTANGTVSPGPAGSPGDPFPGVLPARSRRGPELPGRAAQGAATRAALLDAAAALFGQSSFTETSLDEVVARAGVTKGALYHHFSSKYELFAAVYEGVRRDISDAVVVEFLRPDPWEALLQGCDLWIEAHLDPAVQRIAMRDARAVLGAITTGHGDEERALSVAGPRAQFARDALSDEMAVIGLNKVHDGRTRVVRRSMGLASRLARSTRWT